MAALILSTAGAAVGGALFGPIGAIAGRLVGAIGGSMLDNALLRRSPDPVFRSQEGPRLSDLDLMASTEGAPIPRIYGRVRISGEVIWATALQEVVNTRTETTGGGGGGGGGGKGFGGGGGGGGGGSPVVTTTITTYSYFANIGVGLGEGPIGHVARVWADGKPLDMAGLNVRIYRGTEDQTADPLIVAKEGAANAPAYRGTAYVVFERLPLAAFGNRIPQLSFEIVRPVGRLERMVRAVTLIPGTTEFGYEPGTVVQVMGPGRSAPENRHVSHAPSDVVASLDELQAVCPNLQRVAVVVAWFGSDLRAAQCTIRPAVDNLAKETHGATWSVAGLTRDGAPVVSLFEGRPAYGGTPSDASVTNLIAALKARGIAVTLYPFVMMDIPPGNALADPWTGAASQPAHPWRGMITCDPAPGRPGSPDGTATAAQQVDAFFGGPGEWRYRRMVRHYAQLAADAGGVDAFVIGSELRSLTRVREAPGFYPAVTQLVSLAGEVKAILGSDTAVTYAADWTEYGAHVVDADAQEVRFPLDPLWASPHIDAIGIDYYAPLSDWRDGPSHLDRQMSQSIYDRDYLTSRLHGGEAYDWYYADDAARLAQTRTPIGDGLGKPWLFRQKDIWNFWSNAHHERIGGVELAASTAWVARSKPVWLTEVGCPAVDKGSNQPNVFPDPKSASGGFPAFSNRSRDDLIQRRMLECAIAAFDPQWGADALNPVSPLYGGRMLDPSRIYLWTWDARPYPVFPAATDIWSDGPNWETGHWLTGRLSGTPLEGLVTAVLADGGVDNIDAARLGEGPDGYLVDRPMTRRAAIEPLAQTYAFDAAEGEGQIAFRPRGGEPVAELTEDDLVLSDGGAPFRFVRAQETDLPREISFGFTDAGGDYRRAVASSRRLVGGAARVAHSELAVVAGGNAAVRRAEIMLQDMWAGRESAEFALPPSRMTLEPGDVVALTAGGRRHLLEIGEIVDTGHRSIRARSIAPEVFELALPPAVRRAPPIPTVLGPPHVVTLDLPAITAAESPALAHVAVTADPWPGSVAVWRSGDGLSYERAAQVSAHAVIGETLDDLPKGPTARFHRVRLRVQLIAGELASISDMALFEGAGAAALRREDGAWEVIQFGSAELIGERTYALSRLLRGQAGSEWAMGDPLPAGAGFVVLDRHIVPLARGFDTLERPLQLRVVAASRDHGDSTAVALEVTPRDTALRPLAPVHLRARRMAEGVALSWIRRTRIDGDSWVGEVPLDEPVEAYSIDILSGGAVLRTLESAEPSLLYAEADELADFGAPQSVLSVAVHQLSARVGRGWPARSALIIEAQP